MFDSFICSTIFRSQDSNGVISRKKMQRLLVIKEIDNMHRLIKAQPNLNHVNTSNKQENIRQRCIQSPVAAFAEIINHF